MKYKLTDLMDLYEDPHCPFAQAGAGSGASNGKETTELKQRKHAFGWKEGLSVAAAALLVVAGGFGITRLMKQRTQPIEPGLNSTAATEPFTTAPKPTGFDPVPEEEWEEMKQLINALVRQGVCDLDRDLDGEYELARFAYLYTKQYAPERIVNQSEDDGSYETLSLEQTNETLTRTLGKTVSPAGDTDYTLQRGDNYAQHESYHDGLFWWPAADGEIYTRFAVVGGVRDAGDWGWELVFEVCEADLERWPEYPDWDQRSYEEISDAYAEGKYRSLCMGSATLLKTEHGMQVGAYRLDEDLRAENSFTVLELNELLSALAQQGIAESDYDLAGEYELARFAHLYTKLNHPEAIVYRSGENGSYETLTLEQTNETLTRLLGKAVSPAEATDYTLQRGDNYVQHESYHDGLFWWPAADGDQHTAFALADFPGRTAAAPAAGTTLSVGFKVFEPVNPEADRAALLTLTQADAIARAEAGDLRYLVDGEATVEYVDGALRLVRYNVIPSTEPDAEADEALLSELNLRFSDPTSWYARALTGRFAVPANLDLYALFYDGIPGEEELTPEEQRLLGEELHVDCNRLSPEEMDAVLTQYFGLTLEETAGRGLELFDYLPETGCYYHSHGDTNMMLPQIQAARRLEDGRVLFTYTPEEYHFPLSTEAVPLWTVALKPTENGEYQILSNLPGEWVTAETAPEALAALHWGTGAMQTETQAADGTRSVRELCLEADGSLSYREGDPNSEYSHWEQGGWWLPDDHTLAIEHRATEEDGTWIGPSTVSFYRCERKDNQLILTQISEQGFARDKAGTELRFPFYTK